MTLKRTTEIPTIDVCLVTILPQGETVEYGLDTASKIAVEVQTEVVDAVKLVVKGVLKAQRPQQVTITGNRITMTDNVFSPELIKIMQGGTIKYDLVETEKVIGYVPPVAGSSEKGKVFTLNAYSAQYDAAGQIVRYEKISYPNCQGLPVAVSSEDGVFRVPEYVVDSAPKIGEAPYDIDYVEALPTFGDAIVGYYLTRDDAPLVAVGSVSFETQEATAKLELSSEGFAKLSNGTYEAITISWAFDEAYNGSVAGAKRLTGTISPATLPISELETSSIEGIITVLGE